MVRVLQVFGCLDRGGAESMIMELYRHIDRTKIQFDFVVHTTRKCAYDDEIHSLGGRIFSVPRFTLANSYQYKKEWKTILSKHPEWKIIHGHVRSTASIYLSIAKEHGKFTIIHSHSTSSGKGISAAVKNILQKRIKADYYIACSDAAGKWLFGENVVKQENYTVLHNAIDTSKFSYNTETRDLVRKELDSESNILVGHIGSFYDVKNHVFLLDIFEELINLTKNIKLVLVGDGYLKEDIQELVTQKGLESKVIFTGTRSDVNRLLQAMDVFVFPSKYEGLPVTLVEAQCSGIQIIMSDRIPKETILTDELVTIMSLEQSPQKWAKCILSKLNIKRKGRETEIIKAGYDINTTSKWIEEFYLERNQI